MSDASYDHSDDLDDAGKRMALVDGSALAFKFIAKGMENLSNSDIYNHFAELPLLILSFGTEQLLKLIICSHQKVHTGEYPVFKEIKGHEVHKLSKRVASKCFSSRYLERNDIRNDHDYIMKNETLQELMKLFEWYAGGNEKESQGRYFDLDDITTDKIPNDPVNHGLGSIEMKFIQSQYLGVGAKATDAAGELIVKCLTKYYRILAHLIRFGGIGNISLTSKYTSVIIGKEPSDWFQAMSRKVTILMAITNES